MTNSPLPSYQPQSSGQNAVLASLALGGVLGPLLQNLHSKRQAELQMVLDNNRHKQAMELEQSRQAHDLHLQGMRTADAAALQTSQDDMDTRRLQMRLQADKDAADAQRGHDITLQGLKTADAAALQTSQNDMDIALFNARTAADKDAASLQRGHELTLADKNNTAAANLQTAELADRKEGRQNDRDMQTDRFDREDSQQTAKFGHDVDMLDRKLTGEAYLMDRRAGHEEARDERLGRIRINETREKVRGDIRKEKAARTGAQQAYNEDGLLVGNVREGVKAQAAVVANQQQGGKGTKPQKPSKPSASKTKPAATKATSKKTTTSTSKTKGSGRAASNTPPASPAPPGP